MTKEQKFYKALQNVFIRARIEGKGGRGVFKFYFDASKIESKKANEKRSLIFELNKILDDNTLGYIYPANYMKQYYEIDVHHENISCPLLTSRVMITNFNL